MKKIEYEETKEFQKDFKKLSRRFSTLLSDLAIAKQFSIEAYHLKNIDSNGIKTITKTEINERNIIIYKLRKFACRSLKGGATSGIRIIYALENDNITFLEIYFKGDKENEDKDRLSLWLKLKSREE